jgi:hypothetical protein
MSTTHESISAFVDDEPFDANELAAALADPEGRELLIDLIALRHVVADADPSQVPMAAAPQTRRHLWFAGIAAALLLCASVGYVAGAKVTRAEDVRTASVAPAATDAAPAPTRVITLTPGVNWHDTNGGY